MKTESTPRIQYGLGELVLWLLPSLLLVLSAPPALGQDPFMKITTGPVVTDVGDSTGGAWGDYDDDGLPDLIVSRGTVKIGQPRALNALYHNEGNGTFTKITSGPVTTDHGWFMGGTWGDYDGDGDLDLFVGNATIPGPGVVNVNILYRNLGGGAFEKITSGPMVTGLVVAWTAAWVDFNRDGLLDLFVVSAAGTVGPYEINTPNSLFQNQGNDTFDLVSKPPLTTEIRTCERAAWSDYDNDGRPDVAATGDFLGFYHQETDGSFVLAKEVQPQSYWFSGLAWGDYDNDGLVDLYQGRFFEDTVRLYHNLGGGQFEELRLPGGPNNQTGAWGDYDNDGYLDLFVTEATGQAGDRNQLYRNNRDGTFTQLASGESVVTDPVRSPSTWSLSGSWADYDNDGFLDLFVANGENTSQRNFLYHNDGNANHWLVLRLRGTVSNRSAIGTRVKAQAIIWGKEVSQTRDVGGSADRAQSDLRPHFGLGDATTVTTLRLEWPSGLVQEFANLQANQILAIEEARPILMKPELRPDGTFLFQLNGGVIGQSYVTESSADLADWTAVSTNAGPTALVAIPSAPGSAGSFLRVKQQ